MKHLAFIITVILGLSIGTTAKAYEVYRCWTSKDGWGESSPAFTTAAERVYFNVAASFYETFITNKWYRPDGTQEDDTGTNLLAHPVYEGGFFVGFWTYMVIRGKNREKGQWRVEHWVLDVNYEWHLMCTTYFMVTSAPVVPLSPLLLDGDQ
jgi:hypothetical protein